MEVNPDWVVEEEENGDQLQQQGPWLSPLIPVSKFSLKKRDPRGHGGEYMETGSKQSKRWTLVDTEMSHSDPSSRKDLLPSCEECSQQMASSCQLLQGQPLLRSCPSQGSLHQG